MDNKRVLMYVVHHLCSVRSIQFVTINTKKHLVESVAHIFRLSQTEVAG